MQYSYLQRLKKLKNQKKIKIPFSKKTFYIKTKKYRKKVGSTFLRALL